MDGQSMLAAQAFGIVRDHSTKRDGREELEQLKQDLQQAQAETDRLKWAHKMVLQGWREEQAKAQLYKNVLKHHFGVSLTVDSDEYD